MKEAINQITDGYRTNAIQLLAKFNEQEFEGKKAFAFAALLNSVNAQIDELKKKLQDLEPKEQK